MPIAGSQGKNWCFTLNNYGTDDEDHIKDAAANQGVRYFIFGREVAPSGTKHLQGYIQFVRRCVLSRVKRVVGDRAHVELSRGTPKQAADYCKKDGDYCEAGEIAQGQGARTDLAQVAEACKAGESFAQIAERFPSAALRYGNGIQRLRQLCRPSRTTPPQIWVFWGATGSGKTRRVWQYADKEQLWLHPGGSWFDGYDGHKAAVFDDFDGSWFKLSYLLRLLDRYIMMVPNKGGHAWWYPTTIYLTSNLEPKEWYPNAHAAHQAALMRRISEFGTIVHCTGYPE